MSENTLNSYDGERESEMDYKIWSEMHRLLETSLVRLYDLGLAEASRQNALTGKLRYLLADAIANELYVQRNSRKKA